MSDSVTIVKPYRISNLDTELVSKIIPEGAGVFTNKPGGRDRVTKPLPASGINMFFERNYCRDEISDYGFGKYDISINFGFEYCLLKISSVSSCSYMMITQKLIPNIEVINSTYKHLLIGSVIFNEDYTPLWISGTPMWTIRGPVVEPISLSEMAPSFLSSEEVYARKVDLLCPEIMALIDHHGSLR